MHPTRKLRLRRSRSAPRQGPEIRVYAVNREELHPVHSLDGTLRLCRDEDYPMSLFSARHGLTPKEVALAEALWRRANRLRPIDSTSHRGRCRLSLGWGGLSHRSAAVPRAIRNGGGNCRAIMAAKPWRCITSPRCGRMGRRPAGAMRSGDS
jgi:hypothetical protein